MYVFIKSLSISYSHIVISITHQAPFARLKEDFYRFSLFIPTNTHGDYNLNQSEPTLPVDASTQGKVFLAFWFRRI